MHSLSLQENSGGVMYMNKGGIGVGSSSIVLVFAVLCLTIFSLISFIVTQNTKALVDAEAEFVKGYYRADVKAEFILAELLNSETIPSEIQGISINVEQDNDTDSKIINFVYPIYDTDYKDLFVRVSLNEESYNVLSWRVIDNAEWEASGSFNLWLN